MMAMTSVSGHLMNNKFSGCYKKWQESTLRVPQAENYVASVNNRTACSPLTLFTAKVERYCPENYVPIKVIIQGLFDCEVGLSISNE